MNWFKKKVVKNSYSVEVSYLYDKAVITKTVYTNRTKKKAINFMKLTLEVIGESSCEWLTLGTITLRRIDFRNLELVKN